MYFIIYDTKYRKQWASGHTKAEGTINFQAICEYLMGATHPEIFQIVLFNENGIQQEIALVDYMNRRW